MMRVVIALLWIALIAAMWLTAASCVFLWLAELWDNPQIPSWTRPWQWLVYVRHGNGSFSEGLYLILSAVFASAPLITIVPLLLPSVGTNRPALYSTTGFANRRTMSENGIKTSRKFPIQ